MGILVYGDAASACAAAATLFASQIIEKPDSSLGFVTGGTAAAVYRELIRMTEAGILDWNDIKSFNLSEYASRDAQGADSARTFMETNLFSSCGIRKENVHFPKTTGDLSRSAEEYEKEIELAGGIDLQLLCLGRNCSLGFNLPGREFAPVTHAVELPGADGNRNAVCMGIGTIMNARRIVMLITGEEKADFAYKMLNSAVSPSLPATVLQLHRKVTYLLDEAAAKLL